MNLKYQGISFVIRGIAFLGLGVFMAVSEFLLSNTSHLRWQALLAFPLGSLWPRALNAGNQTT